MCGVLQVQCLQDFFLDVNVFVAYGTERQTLDDYELSNNGKCSLVTYLVSCGLCEYNTCLHCGCNCAQDHIILFKTAVIGARYCQEKYIP